MRGGNVGPTHHRGVQVMREEEHKFRGTLVLQR